MGNKYKDTRRAYYEANREHLLEYQKSYHAKNRETRNAKGRLYSKTYSKLPQVMAKTNARVKDYQKREEVKERMKKKRGTPEYKAGQRARQLRVHYGLTLESFNAMISGQGGKCAICNTSGWGKHGPVVDHCHITGVVRGVLCGRCNLVLGMLKDSPSLAMSVSSYLGRT